MYIFIDLASLDPDDLTVGDVLKETSENLSYIYAKMDFLGQKPVTLLGQFHETGRLQDSYEELVQ